MRGSELLQRKLTNAPYQRHSIMVTLGQEQSKPQKLASALLA
jgi:hypothetical protein